MAFAKQPPPRSAADATRFTATVPHASMSSSAADRAASKPPANPRFQSPSRATGPPPTRRPGTAPAGAGAAPAGAAPAETNPLVGETPAQKVARLRAAHQAAKNHKMSSLDRVITGGRRVFDNAHRFTIIGLISFTAIAGALTAYTAVDMMRYNKQRKAEFIAAQMQMEADSLAAARLAFMRGEATPEQAELVEEANRAAAAANASGEFFATPSLLSAPAAPKGADASSSAPPLAPAPASSASASTSSSSSSPVLSAVERERENQRRGGPLDRIGLDGANGQAPVAATTAASSGKSWWKFW